MNIDETIKFIFAEARKITPENLEKGQEWLNDLEHDAFHGQTGWIEKLKGFIRGLWASEVIEIEDLDDFDKCLQKSGIFND